MKVKNVIKGLLKHYALEEISIISQSDSKCYYSGTVSGWNETEVSMILFKKKVENAEVLDRIMFNNRKAFIFIPSLEC